MRKFLSLTIFMNTLKFLLVANFSLFTILSFVRMQEKPTTTAKKCEAQIPKATGKKTTYEKNFE